MNGISDFTWLRAVLAACPAGPEAWERCDDAIEVLAGELVELYPNAPPDAALAYAIASVRKALDMGSPGDEDGGGGPRGPRAPAPKPSPKVVEA